MRTKLLMKSLLVAAGLFVGANAWAEIEETVVVNCDFNSGETLFTGVSRTTVSNDNNAKFTTAGNSTNGYSLATYDFSSAIGEDATAVKIEFLYWMPSDNSYYRRFFTVGQASLRTGFGKWSYSTAGSMFAFGLARNSSANYFSINGASTTAAASATSVLGAWARAEIYVDHSAKTVDYKITNVDATETYYSADDVAFVDASAAYCNQIDFYDCWNNTTSYLDNLVITKYVDKSKVATTYTVKYQNSEGTNLKDPVVYDTYVGDTYTASSTDMATFYSDDTNTKYVYASGNVSSAAVEAAASNVITLVFDEYSKVAYTVTAKNGEETLGTLVSGDAYTDGSTTVYWSKFKNFDGVWYETTSPYGKKITEAGNTDIAYTASNISYFVEAENMSKSRAAAASVSGTGYSGGYAPRHYASSQWWTETFAEGGIFTLYFPYTMANKSESTVTIETRDADGNFTATGLSLTTSTNGAFTGIVTIPAGSSLAIVKGEYNSNILIDYLTLAPATQSATIGATGYTTFASAYALDLANLPAGLTAYYASAVGTEDVTFTSLDVAVPAGTGLLLKGTASTAYDIPVAASADALAGNKLVGCTAETALTANANYWVLVNNGGAAEFQSLKTKGATIPAGKAYLNAAAAGSRLAIVFDDETTGIATVENASVLNENYYNLNGQRIVAPQKGLYIVNGKKVVLK